MEAPHSCLTTGEQSGGQDRCPSESRPRGQSESPPPPSSKPHGPLQQPRHPRRQHPERKRLRHQRQSVESGELGERRDEAPDATAASGLPPEAPPPSAQEGTPKQKRERKPQRPGKYVCTYCGRACAKPSVLQKHIRSHTGERPYPCGPCGFSFKTKSNLYKHRKSHTHRVKAGLAVGEPRSVDEQATESEDETQQPSDAEKQRAASLKGQEIECSKSWSGGNDDSYAVKKRLALRLSRGKHGPQDSPDEKASALTFGSRGSTESGYFSRSESTEQPQDSPPNTSAKSYAEIILGKYGRLGHLQRTPRQHNQQPPGEEDKGVPFTVPKKQVIDHITKLITINEAVVDTSKIDRVKPRRFSLSRKSSSESLKNPPAKGLLIQAPKAADLGFKSSGSITMGVPCEKFHHSSLSAEKPTDRTPAPLVRSHSMPSPQSPLDSSCGSAKFRSSQSFDRRQPSDRPVPRRYGMLKRQPAIEIPLGAELPKEEPEGSPSFRPDCTTAVPDREERQRNPYECEACGSGCRDWEGLQRHRQNLCPGPRPQNEVATTQTKASQPPNQSVRAGASALRKRRKEESFESDDPASPGVFPGQRADENNVYGGPRRQTPQTCSVIQHTSSFEKQESLSGENQATSSPPDEECPQAHPQQESVKGTQRLVRQHGVQVPEIFVTEDGGSSTGSSADPSSTVARQPEKPEEFQWPQRSPSLSQLPIEKLPPKKKRLRLAEVAQSSGESSFDSASLPRSPSQDSSASYASSRSTSFEEPNRLDAEASAPLSARKSRAPNTLTVPGVHQHKEMRRSASEQAPHDPQPGAALGETRSKSFDYSCLSPERSAVGWRERRKCLLIRHTAVRDPEEEEEEPCPNHRSPESPRVPSETGPSPPNTNPNPSPGEAPPETQPQWESHPPLRNSKPTEEQASHPHKGQAPPPAGSSGAARAHYLPVSTGLKLEIPPAPGVPPSAPLIATGQELLRPAAPPAVAVRLQADTLAMARAIYTTLSQAAAATAAAAPGCRENGGGFDPSLDPQPWPPDHQRAPGSGGSKRMLSPSNSIEVHPESQQQQKRVKEEEGGRGVGEVPDQVLDRVKGEVVRPPVAGAPPPFPSLLPSTCNSWCYLNYTKPNPSALDKHEPSVYSSWSTAGYDPNPPGLSSKTALALLSCRQRPGASVYTTAPMSAAAAEPERGGEGGPPRQVYTSRSYSDQHPTREGLGGLGGLGGRRGPEEVEISEPRSNRTPPAGSWRSVEEPPGVQGEGRSDGGRVGEHLKESGEEPPPGGADPGVSEDADDGQKENDGGVGGNVPERPPPEPKPDGSAPRRLGDGAQKSSASARRALFARRRLDATSSPGGSPAQSGVPERAPTPPRSPSPGPRPPRAPAASTSGTVSPPPGLSAADAPSWGRACLHRLRADEVGPAHLAPPRTRGPDTLLRHLPPHSQRPGRAPSLLIPIGGIHMIQPRSLLPLYTLVSSPSANPPATSWRFGDAPKRRPPLLPQRPAPPGASPDRPDSSPGE